MGGNSFRVNLCRRETVGGCSLGKVTFKNYKEVEAGLLRILKKGRLVQEGGEKESAQGGR